jgi:hypothetical protein
VLLRKRNTYLKVADDFVLIRASVLQDLLTKLHEFWAVLIKSSLGDAVNELVCIDRGVCEKAVPADDSVKLVGKSVQLQFGQLLAWSLGLLVRIIVSSCAPSRFDARDMRSLFQSLTQSNALGLVEENIERGRFRNARCVDLCGRAWDGVRDRTLRSGIVRNMRNMRSMNSWARLVIISV